MNINDLPADWDLVIVGGGITGAGIFRESARMKLRVLLVEQNDFAWGTSSRSSKLVHGGLRYLKQGKLLLTRASVKERERFLKEAPGLVDPLEFLLPIYDNRRPSKWEMEAGLSLYGFLARERQHAYLDVQKLKAMLPGISGEKLSGGFRFVDGQTDDVRLVMRLLQEGRREGGLAFNYTRASAVLRRKNGNVAGLTLEDSETGKQKEIRAPAVINATGAWAENLQPSPDKKIHIRPLRGSHLVLPACRVEMDRAVSLFHPRDGRPIFILPWEGAVLLGTTDMDHHRELSKEPFIIPEEADYLIEGVNYYFPRLKITREDCLSSFAGVRPILSDGKHAPSEESREHVVWKDKGLVTVTGGKLTTFRLLAWDALEAVRGYLPGKRLRGKGKTVFPVSRPTAQVRSGYDSQLLKRLYGRYGSEAAGMLTESTAELLSEIPGTRTSWAELKYAAGNEMVRHLPDLLLRRVRIGLLVPDGAKAFLDRIEQVCEPELGWGPQRWADERTAYLDLWNKAYRLPPDNQSTGVTE